MVTSILNGVNIGNGHILCKNNYKKVTKLIKFLSFGWNMVNNILVKFFIYLVFITIFIRILLVKQK